MKPNAAKPIARVTPDEGYRLEEQVGYILRQASQRHAAIFAARIPEQLTTTQFATLVRLQEVGPCSQNQLGRLTAMDAATIKGVTDRLIQRGFVEAKVDPEDGRRRMLALTPAGLDAVARAIPAGLEISAETLEPLSAEERAQFMALLKKLR
ncbi:MarR family winged helix-turn-helix transcriptional regulator [Dongia sp.]|uniref:MarR family winged helix-turn-helix transcriptional regulator n=1 Tax=Dongia sp. TaxID=1977262 RepID=UPI0037535618